MLELRSIMYLQWMNKKEQRTKNCLMIVLVDKVCVSTYLIVFYIISLNFKINAVIIYRVTCGFI